jgi:hypothetical protein
MQIDGLEPQYPCDHPATLRIDYSCFVLKEYLDAGAVSFIACFVEQVFKRYSPAALEIRNLSWIG